MENNEIKDKIKSLSKEYSYKPLPKDLSEEMKEVYMNSIPSFLKMGGENCPLYNSKGTKICDKYSRVVVGDYGAYVEFLNEDAKVIDFMVEPGQEYRSDPKYNVKYHWYTTIDGSRCKLYYQVGTVKYADYKVGRWYISIYEVEKKCF